MNGKTVDFSHDEGGLFDVLGIGHALLDVIAPADEDFLVKHAIVKGAMQLIEADRAEALYKDMGTVVRVSGGSAANTLVGVASFGVRAAFIGKIAQDPAGEIFTHDIRGAGVYFAPHFPVQDAGSVKALSTGRCYILVTPDGERTMQTHLGAGRHFGLDDLDESLLARSKILYLEGYLWDMDKARIAMQRAAKFAHQHQRIVALSLSDTFCVDRWRDAFLGLIASGAIDLVFANEHELKALYQTGDADTALAVFAQTGLLGAITQGAEGAVVVEGAARVTIPAAAIDTVVDTTGAGDLFASGFLAGLVRGKDYKTCGALGALAAGEIIQHFGARPLCSLKERAEAEGLW